MNEAFLLGAAWRLAPPERLASGAAGSRLGRRPGSSLEFHEHRDYQPGDDPRHVDWRASARADRLLLRRHREEVSATVELVLDDSRSMALTPAKAEGLRALAAFFAGAASGEHALRAFAAADPPRPLEAAALRAPDARLLPLAAERSLPDLPLAGLLRAGALRIVVSDFLFPHPPAAVARVAADAGRALCVQLLDVAEAEPALRGSLRLREVEGGSQRDLEVDEAALALYRNRLARLGEDLASALRPHGAVLVRAIAGRDTAGAGLAAWARAAVAPTNWLEER